MINLRFRKVCQVIENYTTKLYIKITMFVFFLNKSEFPWNLQIAKKVSVLTLKCAFFLKLHPQQSSNNSKL